MTNWTNANAASPCVDTTLNQGRPPDDPATDLTEVSTYIASPQTAAFRRSRERWGEFSNMTGGYPIPLNDIRFQSSESMYQALKFPHDPNHQARIGKAHSGYAAKTVAYQRRDLTYGWDGRKVDAMRVALDFKLAQNSRFAVQLANTRVCR